MKQLQLSNESIGASQRVQVKASICQKNISNIQKNIQKIVPSLIIAGSICSSPAIADLNKYEYDLGGEFGFGSAQQWGSSSIEGKDFSNQDLRRANFTSADARKANFSNSNLQGSYFTKSITYAANFENAILSDTLFDRAVSVEANFKNAVLQRVVFARSDLARSNIEGADFTNAIVDKAMQRKLCKIASGTNTITGADTRESLGCTSSTRYKSSSPSSLEGPQVTEEEKIAFNKTLPAYTYGGLEKE